MSKVVDAIDYFVVVKNRARLPKPWRWEIHRSGRQSPVAQSPGYFDLRGTAIIEGRAALDVLLKKPKL